MGRIMDGNGVLKAVLELNCQYIFLIVTSAQILCFAPNISVQFDLFIIAIVTGVLHLNVLVIHYIMK